jgi:hypothetical protein
VKEELDIDQRKDYGLVCSSSIQIGVVRGPSIPTSMHFSLYRFPGHMAEDIAAESSSGRKNRGQITSSQLSISCTEYKALISLWELKELIVSHFPF